MKKKADLSVNTVIIAVLALLVLIVLAFIFSGRLKTFSSGTGECKGECKACVGGTACTSPCTDKASYKVVSANVKDVKGLDCTKDKSYCCLDILG